MAQLAQQSTVPRPVDAPFNDLPKVVVAHLTYLSATSGNVTESSLSAAIQTFLRVKKRSTWADIVTEHAHPSLGKAGLGRPPAIDFVGMKKLSSSGLSAAKDAGNEAALSFALETKLHKATGDWARIVQDVVKLLLIADNVSNQNVAKYLLLAFPITSTNSTAKPTCAQIVKTSTGETLRLNEEIWIPKQASINLFEVLLPAEKPDVEIWLGKLPASIRDKFDSPLRDWGKQSVRGDVKIIKIGLDWSDDFACGLWRLDWKGPANRYFPLQKTTKHGAGCEPI